MANAAITVDLNAKIAQFETELKKATGSLDRFEKKSTQVAAGFKTAFGALGAAVSVGALAAFAKSGIDAADALNDMSQRLGVSVKDLASLQLAAKLADTSLEGVGKGIARLSRSIGEAEAGNAKLAKALTDLGITARDPKEAFFQLADATKKIEDPAKRAALLNQVLGKSYLELVPLLEQGGDALRESAKASESFADSMAKMAPDAGKFNDQIDTLKQNVAGASAALLTRLIPSLNETAKSVADLLNAGNGLQALIRAFGGLGKLPFDAVFGKIKAATTATGRLKEMRGELAELERVKARAKGSILDRVFGTPKGLDQRITVMKNQIATVEKFGDKIYKKDPPKAKPANIKTNFAPAIKTRPARAAPKADPQVAFIEKLRQEAATLGLTGEALQRYEARKLKLTGANQKLANSYISQISAFNAQQDAAKANNEAFDEAIRKQQELDSALENSIKGVREWIAEQEFEVSLIGLSNSERETAIQLRALETAGIDTQTGSYKVLAEQIAAANLDKRGLGILSGTQTEKTKEFMTDVDALNQLFFDGKIGAQQFSEGMELITGSTQKAAVEMDEFAKNAAKGIQDSMADFLFDPFKDGMDGMVEGFGKMLQRMIADAAAAQLARAMFGGLSDGGKTGGSGWIGGLLEMAGGLFASANGNAFANGAGLSQYSGTIVSRPTIFPFAKGAGLMGEAGPEVILPLKRGSNGKLGVQSGGGGSITVVVNGANNAPDVRRAAAHGAREAMGMMSAAKRYA